MTEQKKQELKSYAENQIKLIKQENANIEQQIKELREELLFNTGTISAYECIVRNIEDGVL